ncbi:hypothetical protein D3C72_1858540 [compost metagenome]
MHVVRAVSFVLNTLLKRHVLHALPDQCLRLGVQNKLNAQSPCCALARVVVWRGANTTAREHDVPVGERALQRGGEAIGVVAHIVRIRQGESAGR